MRHFQRPKIILNGQNLSGKCRTRILYFKTLKTNSFLVLKVLLKALFPEFLDKLRPLIKFIYHSFSLVQEVLTPGVLSLQVENWFRFVTFTALRGRFRSFERNCAGRYQHSPQALKLLNNIKGVFIYGFCHCVIL
jgi:hypothetical protein